MSSCPGESGTIFVQTRKDQSILQLDATSSVFKGPIRTLHTDRPSFAMCYIPPPNNLLVLELFGDIFALSVEKDEVIWENENKLVGFLFYPKYDVLLTASPKEDTLSVVNPETGNQMATLSLPYTPREDRDVRVFLCLCSNETFAILNSCEEESEIYRIKLS